MIITGTETAAAITIVMTVINLRSASTFEGIRRESRASVRDTESRYVITGL